jgi:hypothetical protein
LKRILQVKRKEENCCSKDKYEKIKEKNKRKREKDREKERTRIK